MRNSCPTVAVIVFSMAATFFGMSAAAAEPESMAELERLLTKQYSALKGWSAECELVALHGGNELSFRSTMSGKGDAYTAEWDDGEGGTDDLPKTSIVRDGDGIRWEVSEVTGETPEITKMNILRVKAASRENGPSSGGEVEMTPNPVALLAQYGGAYDLVYKGIEEIDDERVYVVEGTATEAFEERLRAKGSLIPGERAQTIRMTFGAADGLVRMMAYLDGTGTPETRTIFSNIQLNPEFDPARFTYSPPEGVEVDDVTAQLEEAVR